MKIYIAHQISSLSYEEVTHYYHTMKVTLETFGYDVLNPMTAKGFLRTEKKFKSHGYGNPISTNHAIVERDRWMVNQCDVFYCDFSGTVNVSIGCICELAWASLWGKHTITVIPKDNIHQHAFILECSDITFNDTADAIKYLKYLSKGEVE